LNRIFYSPEARNDLARISEYIEIELANSVAAQNTIGKIAKHIRQLERFSEMGALLSSVVDIATEHRFLVSGSYLVFYRAVSNEVYIDRVIHGGRDYVKILSGDVPQDDDLNNF
jgi:plasmid stabilization system protein ParE